MDLVIVFCTFPDRDCAARVATALVEASLVACVNVLPAVESIYRWEERLETASEVLALMKTAASAYPALEARLKELHPYEVPEIIAVPAAQVHPAYAAWVEASTAQPS